MKLYYKSFILCLYVNAFFLAAYYVSFVWQIDVDLDIFKIAYRAEAAVDEFVYGYPREVFPILAILIPAYTGALLIFSTDYLSKERIAAEKQPISHSNKNLYDLNPLYFVVLAAFLILTGLNLWVGPHWMQEYLFYVHDFRAQTLVNFLTFSAFYFSLYQSFYCQCLVFLTIEASRSALKHLVYRF